MKITTLSPDNDDLIRHAAQLLVDAFREHWPDAWPTLEDGLKEVHEMLESNRICRVGVDNEGNLLGIIGGIPSYDGFVWECVYKQLGSLLDEKIVVWEQGNDFHFSCFSPSKTSKG